MGSVLSSRRGSRSVQPVVEKSESINENDFNEDDQVIHETSYEATPLTETGPLTEATPLTKTGSPQRLQVGISSSSPCSTEIHARAFTKLNGQEVAKATSNVKELLKSLDKGEYPGNICLKNTLSSVLDILSSLVENAAPQTNEINENLTSIKSDEVRAWLASTFTTSDITEFGIRSTKLSLKGVARTIMVGQYFRKMIVPYTLTYPPGVLELFEEQLNNWNCDMFKLEELTDVHPLKYTAYEIFNRHELIKEFNIIPATFEVFLTRVEESYQLHGNPYHNSTHAADVVQTVHSFLKISQLENWLTKLEVLSLLFAAVIHDVEHTGTTNNFHIQSYSDMSLCYNDQSVLENYHLNRAYTILKEDDANIFKQLTTKQFVQVRSLVIGMVLATDMSKHFDQMKLMKNILSSPNAWNQLEKDMRPKLLSLLLHIADISHPGKQWTLHETWSTRLIEEFFRQGDKEKAMDLPCSPLCDRTNIVVPESQKGFIDFIVRPSFIILGDTLELINRNRGKIETKDLRVWTDYIEENHKNWKDKAASTV